MSFDKGTHNQTLSKTEHLTREVPVCQEVSGFNGLVKDSPSEQRPEASEGAAGRDLGEGSGPRTLRWTRAWHV